MKLALLVIGNGRDYIFDTVPTTFTHITHPITARLMVNDAPHPSWANKLASWYPDFTIVNTGGLGMAGAVQAGFDLVLAHDPDYVFWQEDDLPLVAPIPVAAAIDALESHPNVAQMLFQRNPINDAEVHAGSVLGAMTPITDYGDWATQQHIFSLNPCIIPKRVLAMGWSPDNEAGMTTKLLDAGMEFGVWKGQRVVHVGAERGKGWRL